MSAADFQKALVRLVKLPDHFRGEDIHDFLNSFDLTELELKQLMVISNSKYFNSFSSSERSKRFSLNVEVVYQYSLKILGRSEIKEIYEKDFEPNNLKLQDFEIAYQFKNFLLDFIRSTNQASYLKDVVEYEFCEYQVYGGRIDQQWSVPSFSLLKNDTPFLIQSFEHNLIDYFELLKEGEVSINELPAPEKSLTTLLFMRCHSDDGEEMSQFEIDDELKSFLCNELKGKSHPESLPSCYSDLVELGLCRPLS